MRPARLRKTTINKQKAMNVKLTEKEFDTIIEALEQLPNKNNDGRLARRLMLSMMCENSTEAKEKAQEQLAIQELKEDAELKERKKKCGMITGKLYMMKNEIVE